MSVQIPGIKESIANGDLSITNASLAQTFTHKHKLDAKTVVERIKNKTTRECQKELELIANENSLKIENPKPRTINYGDKTLVKVYLDTDKLQLLKSKTKTTNEELLLQNLIDEKLKSLEPKLETKTHKHKENSLSRSISPSKKAFVLKKANQQCELCLSKFNLEIDHIKPVAKGGSKELRNLRLLCRSCNLRQAIILYGQRQMSYFF